MQEMEYNKATRMTMASSRSELYAKKMINLLED